MIMKLKLLVIIFVIFVLAGESFAQQDSIFDSQNKERGYSRVIGDKTYFYDNQGREKGYARTLGDRTYNFDSSGNEVGYSQKLGGTNYIFGERKSSGDPVGYFRSDEGTTGEQKPAAQTVQSDSQQVFDQGQGGYSWGVSGPPSKEGE